MELSGLDDLLETLWALSQDKTGTVREALYTATGEWLLKLPDRYSIGYKILPLLLSGINDEMPKIAQKSLEYMNEAGRLYEVEWESRVKDEMDYTDGLDTASGIIYNISKLDRKTKSGMSTSSAGQYSKDCQQNGGRFGRLDS